MHGQGQTQEAERGKSLGALPMTVILPCRGGQDITCKG
jgi:hypothetical protein